MMVGMRTVIQGGEIRELGSNDDEGREEKEESRTHSVKFSDEAPETDKEVRKLLVNARSFIRSKFQTLSKYLMCWRRAYSYDSLYENYIN